MIKEAIARVVERHDLSESEMIEVMNEVMGGGDDTSPDSRFYYRIADEGGNG